MPWPTSVTVHHLTPSLTVVAGTGGVRAHLARQLVEHGVARPALLRGTDADGVAALELARETLGDGWDPVVLDAWPDGGSVETVRDRDVDAVVVAGGGETLARTLAVASDAPPLELVCVATTASAAALALTSRIDPGSPPRWGDTRATPRTVFLDAEATTATSAAEWCASGIAVLDDALRDWCRSDSEPFVDPVLQSAVGAFGTLLPRGREPGARVERQHVLTATWMVEQALPRLNRAVAGPWFSTVARDALVASLGMAPDVAACLALPAALRFHAEETAARQDMLRRAVSWTHNIAIPTLADAVDVLLAELELPTTLTAAGVLPDGAGGDPIDELAQAVVTAAPSLGPARRVAAACEVWRG